MKYQIVVAHPDNKVLGAGATIKKLTDDSHNVEGGMVSLAEWLRDFKDAKCVYIYDKKDRGPWDEVIKNWENFKLTDSIL